MKYSTQTKKSFEAHPLKWIFSGLTLVTIYFQTNIADPFNSPKFWLIMIFSAWMIGYIWKFRNIIHTESPIKKAFLLCFMFITSSLSATVFSDNFYISVFGETMRKNGFLSYFSLATIMLSTAMFVRIKNVTLLFKITLGISVLTVIYGLMQSSGNDFIAWNNPYNPIITTLGNPNFAAALMAIMSILIFSTLFVHQFNLQVRISAAILCLLLIYVVIKSNARQGLIAYLIGIGFFLIIYLWGKNKWIGVISLLFGVVIATLAILGMLQKGPFANLIYKGSVSVRGFYWRAGFEMFKDHPFTGVGMDRYGAYFKQYRESEYSLRHGFEITSNNAHNTFIQFFATGGVFLGLTYLILNMYILKRAFMALKKNSGDHRLIIAGVVSAWLGFHAQSLVSIDNIGLSVWGWVLGGTIIGISVATPTSVTTAKQSNLIQGRETVRFLISSLCSTLVLILILVLYRGEAHAINSMMGFDSQSNTEAREAFKEINFKTINTPLIDPSYKLTAAMKIVQAGFIDEGLAVAENILQKDPINLDAINSVAVIYEQTNNLPAAIAARKKIARLDPWNAANYLQLGKNYKIQGDLINSKLMLNKILSFASNNAIATQALSELGA